MAPKRGTWVWDPHSGGVKIPERVRGKIAERIVRHAESNYAGKFARLDIRFRGFFCYIDAYREPEEPDEVLLRITGETREEFMERLRKIPTHLCRLRYFGREDEWSLAFYTYSNERYEPSIFHSGSFMGSVEEGFDVGAVYLHD